MKQQTIVVSQDEAGQPLAGLLRERLGLSWTEAKRLVRGGGVRLGRVACADPAVRVRLGQSYSVGEVHEEKQYDDASPRVRYVDDHVVVVEKPAGLTTMRHAHEAAEFGHRGRRFLPDTLEDVLPKLLASQGHGRVKVRAVHRLDKDSSGLVVFARTPMAVRHLGHQFRQHTTERTYLAIVRGNAVEERIESWFIADRGDGRRGSGKTGAGQHAVTHVCVVEKLGDFTLVQCRLETGRTHQVRIHLGERGTPIGGERVYDRPLHGAPVPDASGAKRLMLHAATLGFEHPLTGQRLRWKAALPRDMEEVLRALRT